MPYLQQYWAQIEISTAKKLINMVGYQSGSVSWIIETREIVTAKLYKEQLQKFNQEIQ